MADMRWLKGVVIATAKDKVRIELDTGRKVWATPHFKLSMCEQVLIAWDYTNDCIGTLTTKKRWESLETEQSIREASTIDVFLSPVGDEIDGDLNGSEIPSNKKLRIGIEDDEPTSMIDVFPIPTNEDVDCDPNVGLPYGAFN